MMEENLGAHSIKILVVDDDVKMLELLKKVLTKRGYIVETSPRPKEALEKFSSDGFDIVVTDINMPEINGLEILKQVKSTAPDTIVIMITAFATVSSAVESMKLGAYDYIIKPFNMEEFILIIERAAERISLKKELEFLLREVQQKYSFGNIIGKSPQMQKVFQLIKQVANTNSNVIIYGKSGTGKELVAKAIHYNSPRRDKPFVAVNCSAIPESLLESELFGHEKGAFTGAVSSRKGLFEEANGGTIFLDEVGDMSLAMQAKLLRVLEDKEIRAVGSDKPKKVDVRVIAATHKDLEKAVKEGTFREDLFYRLNVIPIYLPELRERVEDIPLLVEYFLKKYGEEAGRPNIKISREALACLMKYSWPGNVRELENLIERLVVLSTSDEIKVDDLPPHIRVCKAENIVEELTLGEKITLEELEKRYILKVLRETGWHKSNAAKILGIDRRTLYRKIEEYKLEEPENTVEDDESEGAD
ncbi:sigma-54-dependent transcriptional regulator [Candidatus Chrysopegis kryptomonas]|uniref:Two-component system, NtrC family, response regulator PilR n=1 Tax=Candidatus Chryseopegocella kryptomonas TaxID=1633643 RepID=A0A0P1MQY1_9BACT|nr:sigma-54 dependent transcriptional regulator [Candidatus Chrysopegis kryptomonas]CUS98230.1 two-component system, NtrC family, response regulator PilR [Candidatus Chrysopegis kryptomonas]